MSKLVKYLTPAVGGTALLMGGAYVAANAIGPAERLDLSDFPASRTVVAQASAEEAAPAAAPVASTQEVVAAVAEPSAVPTTTEEKAAILVGGGGPDGLMLVAAPGAPEGGFGLGRSALEEEVAAWDIDIRPDGQGLPIGSGDVWTGEEIWIEQCAACHGDFGEAVGRWPVIAGGQGTLDSEDPVKTTGSYWPYLSTVWDYVHRAMPFGEAQSLTDDQVYALTAYILYSNDLVDDDFELSNENFGEVRLPNEENFFFDDRAETELPSFTGEPCMSDCTDGPVEVTMRSMVLDVTPDSGVVTEAAAATDDAAGISEDDASAEMAAVVQQDAEEVVTAETGEAGEAVVEASQEGEEALAALDPVLVADGEKAFRQCASCHQVGDGARNRSGPVLNGIVGHPIGVVEGFRYSNAIQEKAGEVWSEENLAAFLADPKGWLPGTKMSFRGVRSEEEIAALIAYLQSTGE